MDKLLTNLLGGFPFELDDLRWQFEAYEKAFKGIADGIGDCILSGCVVTPVVGSNYDISAGFIMWQGEIREFPGFVNTELLGGPALYALQPEDTLDPSGSETFEDLSTQNAYQKRRASIFFDVPGTGINLVTGPRLRDRITALTGIQVGVWHVIGAPGEPAFENGYSGGTGEDAVMFRLELNGVVRLRGTLIGSGATGTNVRAFTLPVNFRPSVAGSVTGLLPKPTLTAPTGDAHRSAYVTPSGDFIVYLDTPDILDRFNLAAFPTFVAYH